MAAKTQSKPKPKPKAQSSDLEGRVAALEQIIADAGGRHARLLRRASK